MDAWGSLGKGLRRESCLPILALTLTLGQTFKLSEPWFSYAGKQILPSFISMTELVFTYPFNKYLLNTNCLRNSAGHRAHQPADGILALRTSVLTQCETEASHCALRARVDRR